MKLRVISWIYIDYKKEKGSVTSSVDWLIYFNYYLSVH